MFDGKMDPLCLTRLETVLLVAVVHWEKTGNCAKLEKLSALGENAAPERISIFDRK